MPLPVPVKPDVTVMNESLLTAVHPHVSSMVKPRVAAPPAAVAVGALGENKGLQTDRS